MPRQIRLRAALLLTVAGIGSAACHHTPPAVAVAPRPATDDGARLARARADSIARAEAARREAVARADSLRRAEAMRAAEAAARGELTLPIHFDLDRAEILASERAVLDQKVLILNANPSIRLRVDGNADERGSDEYNIALGRRRAAQARRYLTDRGIDSTRIATASNGAERPLCSEHAEPCWSRNRRDEFIIVAGGERITAAR